MRYIRHGLLQLGLLIVLVSNVNAANLQPLSQRQAQLVLPETTITTLQMPVLDNAALIQRDITIKKALARQKPIIQFAEPQPTTITPNTLGTWETIQTNNESTKVWRMTIQSVGAVSMNLGFTKYFMPEGGELFIYSPNHKQVIGPFTDKENVNKGQLWTPIINGDTIIIELNIPEDSLNDLILELTKVNHGYQKFTAKAASGECNVDVACPVGNAWGDQIRSVGVYSFGGARVCTGAAINNTSQDNIPYFLTAAHCTITPAKASSVVIYWNYQNPFCRQDATVGNAGTGSTAQFTTGTTYVSGYDVSDFTLVKLNQAIPSAYNVFLSGWDRSINVPSVSTGIHHPSVQEKRISVAPVGFTTIESSPRNASGFEPGFFFRIISWATGTTEGGSSGSPLFDDNKRIVGQLFGGSAACTGIPSKPNGKPDFYGRINKSWIGNNTPNSRLSDWLDPKNTGVNFIDGKNINGTNTATNILQNNIPVLIASEKAKSRLEYKITIPAGATNLHISTRSTISDADLYVKFASAPTLSVFDNRSWNYTSNEDITISTPQVGTYFIVVYGYTDYSNLTLTASFDLDGTIQKVFSNNISKKILNEATVNSFIDSDYTNNAGTLIVDVNIKHTNVNELTINLISPNNQTFNIKSVISNLNNTQNFTKSTTITIPSGISKGRWRLDVQDNAKLDSGYIEYWKISLP